MNRIILYCLILSIILPGTVWAGKFYKWTDKNGKVHYSDSPVKAANPNKIEIKRGLKRSYKLSLPNPSNSGIQVRINRGEKLEAILPPAPPTSLACKQTGKKSGSNNQIVQSKDCITEMEVRKNYEEKRQARMKAFYTWKDKQDGANQNELAKLERERILIQKEKESLEQQKEDKTNLKQPGNVATSDPLTKNNQQDIALQKDLALQRELGTPAPLTLPVFSNEDIDARLGRGEVWDTLLPPYPSLPNVCRNTGAIPDFTQRARYQGLCDDELKARQTYEKKKLKRIREYFDWKDAKADKNRGLSQDANQAQLDRVEREKQLLKKEKEQLKKLRSEMGVQR